MPDHSQRLYGDKEISRILKQAASMQQEAAPDTSGLTLEELQQVAAEAGIDPRFVALAASEMGRTAEPKRRPFHVLGGPVSILEERTIDETLTEAEREEMVVEVRRTFRKAGTAGQVGRMLEWTHSERNDQIQVTITERGGKTYLRVFERFPKMTVLTFVLPLTIMLQVAINVPLILGVGALAGWAWALTLLAMTFLASRFGYSRLVERKERRARELLDRLARLAASAEEEPGQVRNAARLDAAMPEDEAPEAAAPEHTSARRRTSS